MVKGKGDTPRRTARPPRELGPSLEPWTFANRLGTQPMSKRSASRRVTVTHPPGLHARPSLSVVKTVQKYQARVLISNGIQEVDARDILQVMSLGAPHGSELALSAEGSDAEEALDALERLFRSNFGFGDE
jgi:phosphocarrier protein HPr